MKLPGGPFFIAMMVCLGALLSASAPAQSVEEESGGLHSPSAAVEEWTRIVAAAAAGRQSQNREEQLDASISGVVADTTGAVVPAAHVKVTSSSSGIQRSAAAANDGSFRFAGLHAGIYTVAVAAKGFSAWNSDAIALTPGQRYELPQVALRAA